MSIDKGSIVEFLVKGQPRFAQVEGTEGKSSLRVADSFGNHLVVSERDLTFRSSDYRLADRSLAGDLTAWKVRSDAEAQAVDLETVWELLEGAAALHPLEALADCLWGELTLERAYALFRTLKDDKVYFKERAGSFERRSPTQVEEAKKQAAALSAKESVQKAMVNRLQARMDDSTKPLESEELRRLEAVQKVALWGDEAPDKNLGLDLLKLMGRPQTEAAAFGLLVDLGLWSVHENLGVHRLGLKAEFSDEVESAVQKVVRNDPAAQRDLTALETITIDDASTSEVDDALSIEPLPDGRVRLWIHIADPGRWIAEGDPLDQEARRRGTTVYLPQVRLTMFPPQLAETVFSLNPGAPTPALSFACLVADDGTLVEFEAVSSLIQVSRRLTYEDAENLVDQKDPLLQAVAHWARVRADKRSRDGAVTIRLPETKISVSGDGHQLTVDVYQSSQARDWVAEWMILAGEAAAKIAVQAQLPLLFRVQKPGEPVSVDHLPEGPAREFGKIVSMTRSGFSTTPGPHAGLGLEAYVQATSPIRRYADLVVHRQLKTWAAGQPPAYSREQLEGLAAELDPLSGQAAKLERHSDRYWVTEHLRRHKGAVWDVVLVGWFREDDKIAQVLFVVLGFRTTMKLTKTKTLGERFAVKVAACDPRKELLTLVEA